MPRPVGPRVAQVRVPEPIDVSAWIDARPADTASVATVLLALLRDRMQTSLDQLADDLSVGAGFRTYPNPFR